MEYEKIDARLSRPNVHFVPKTRLGRDVSFAELSQEWGISALLLANGAWRDRRLDLPGVDAYVGKGLAYQNPFIQWFNHENERSYAGPRFEIPDSGCLVVGGGLASLDVVKVIQLELYARALRKRGIETDVLELEHEGIPETLRAHGIPDPKSLGVNDGVLIYRRRAEDMPLAQEPDDATPEQKRKTEQTRRKILDKVREKFLFRFEERRVAHAPIIEDGRLRGLVVRETRVDGRRADPVPGSEREVRADLVVSSIGSVPEKIDGISMQGEYYTYKDWDTGEYEGVPGVFGVGNVLTGQGNIRVSFVHGQFVGKHLLDSYLGGGDAPRTFASGRLPAVERAAATAEKIADRLRKLAKLSPPLVSEILGRVKTLQGRAGYDGDYKAWIQAHTPPDLE
jgi:NADPH-dependent glutamate synthase beta subunit-like oxidoreductase